MSSRPFRAPHHSTTPPGLVGGGASVLRPGEVTLAHNGVLFLDELPEFSRAALEVLAEPVVAGGVVFTRASGTIRFPASCRLVASMAACPCGSFPEPRCRCSAADRLRYRTRISPRVFDLFDVRVSVAPIDVSVIEDAPAGESSLIVAARVAAAHQRALSAPADTLDAESDAVFARSVESGLLASKEEQERALRVARTIAALAGDDRVTAASAAEAIELARDPR